MKEVRFFYDPELEGELPQDEAQHAVRVLRLKEGDEIFLMNGRGTFCRAEITTAANHHCLYSITERMPQERPWRGYIHLAVAPTKLNDRMEWLVEKATEVGWDEVTFLDCQFSERHVIKTDRMEKIIVSAVKQSHKAWMPKVNQMTDFRRFITEQRQGQKFICHCYDATSDGLVSTEKPRLDSVLRIGEDATVLIGPEGDFSVDEVRMAQQNGWKAVSLGKSRLRTETAALVAVHFMQISNE